MISDQGYFFDAFSMDFGEFFNSRLYMGGLTAFEIPIGLGLQCASIDSICDSQKIMVSA